MSDIEPREQLAEAFYDAWWQGVSDSRASVGDQPAWASVTPKNRERFYRWASEVMTDDG